MPIFFVRTFSTFFDHEPLKRYLSHTWFTSHFQQTLEVSKVSDHLRNGKNCLITWKYPKWNSWGNGGEESRNKIKNLHFLAQFPIHHSHFQLKSFKMHSPSVHPHQHLHRKAEPYRPLRILYVDIPGMSPHNTMETFWCKQGLIGGLQTTNKSSVWKESTGIVKATLWNWIPDSFDRNEKSVKFTYVSPRAFYKLANSQLCILL